MIEQSAAAFSHGDYILLAYVVTFGILGALAAQSFCAWRRARRQDRASAPAGGDAA